MYISLIGVSILGARMISKLLCRQKASFVNNSGQYFAPILPSGMQIYQVREICWCVNLPNDIASN